MTVAARSIGGWRRAVAPPALQRGEVHVWRAHLDVDPDEVGDDHRRPWGWLSTDEQQRARTFHSGVDRRRFVARRGLLRILLGAYLDRSPADVVLAVGSNGKPALAAPGPAPAIAFSCASSRGLALCAVTGGPAVGVDVEAVRPLADLDGVVALCCSPREQRLLGRLPPPTRLTAFLEAWTAKEAYLKAVGDGLTLAPDRVDVASAGSGDPDGTLRLVLDGDARAGRSWQVRRLLPAGGHVAAVAVDRPPVAVVPLDATLLADQSRRVVR